MDKSNNFKLQTAMTQHDVKVLRKAKRDQDTGSNSTPAMDHLADVVDDEPILMQALQVLALD